VEGVGERDMSSSKLMGTGCFGASCGLLLGDLFFLSGEFIGLSWGDGSLVSLKVFTSSISGSMVPGEVGPWSPERGERELPKLESNSRLSISRLFFLEKKTEGLLIEVVTSS